ncbi:zinc-binding alcohol dehydrogenase [Actinophytocola sp. NPDC049390]|uniref:zinc-binding alcohol dehydrogenase n=1 Tax=Actinophytocola sp. NPDC049390 TaxID=3363894 RepID=UPI00378CD2F6
MDERVLVVEEPGRVCVATERAERPAEGEFRAETVYSGLSAGTELSFLKGTNPFLHATWDTELGLFRPGGVGYPVRKLGYMEVAVVRESRTPAVTAGTTVAMTYGHRSGYRADPLADRVVPLPDDLDPLLGIYVAHMGPICANGLLHAAAELHGTDVRALADGVLGRRIAVTGAGVVGVLTALFARHHGAEEVVLVDPTPERQAAATALGFEVLDPGDDPATTLKSRWRHAAGDRGADVVFQCRGNAESLAIALRLLRPQGTAIDLAFYGGGAEALRLGEEFHHNGLTIRCAQIGRVPRGTAHLWDRERLSAETIQLLRAEGKGVREHVITDLVPLDHAPALLADLADHRRHVLQAVFTFDDR